MKWTAKQPISVNFAIVICYVPEDVAQSTSEFVPASSNAELISVFPVFRLTQPNASFPVIDASTALAVDVMEKI